jgi:hypothetical protein
MGFRNRIINGNMVIDQRNAGASKTTSDVYTVDRWAWYVSQATKFTWGQNLNSVTPPVGFSNYFGFQSSSAYSVISSDYFQWIQQIEGFNTADLAWGTANAKTVTLSFWVYSSLTGTFAGGVMNSASNRAYPFTFSIPVANTWTQISVTIAGDTTGTWVGATNGTGISVRFNLGAGSNFQSTANTWGATGSFSVSGAINVVGTNGATFYITGVQLEAGSVASPFERRAYGQELVLCQRYYYRVIGSNNAYLGIGQVSNTGASSVIQVPFPVTMRVNPLSLDQTGTASNYKMSQASTANVSCTSVPTLSGNGTPFYGGAVYTASGLGGTAGQATMGSTDGTGYLGFSAEL